MKNFVREHVIWFLFGGVVGLIGMVGFTTIFVILTYGDPIGTQLQYLGSKLIAAGQEAKIDRQTPEDFIKEQIEAARQQILAEKEELQAKMEVIESQRVSCETMLDGSTRKALSEARKRIGG